MTRGGALSDFAPALPTDPPSPIPVPPPPLTVAAPLTAAQTRGALESTGAVDLVTQLSPDLRQATFRLDRSAFDRLTGGEPVVVRYGREASTSREWTFGSLDRSRLDR